MLNISSAAAKNDFSNVLKSVQKGEKFVIEYGRKHKKIAMIVPYKEPKKADTGIKIGLYKDKFDFKIHGDWAMTAEELLGLDE
ncbi:MAG: type II toxin-antitoxin system Phd/YefM family antitoxin [Candidatus Thioglobus sp.]|nr:type II toxin-antitoxin system Phd/YefM family antitoxin [Candidatus Thioglobus sp.]